MNYFERADANFVEQAADDAQRKLAIEKLTKTRNGIFWCAVLTNFLFVAAIVCGLLNRKGGAVVTLGSGFGAAIQWLFVMKFESDLRLLKLVDKLKK